MDRPLSESKPASHFRRPPQPLKGFDLAVHQYGTYFNGFSWDFIGCLTFRYSVSHEGARKLLFNFFDRLEEQSDTRVAWIAAWEMRYSGCGLPAIPLHSHFLMACPSHRRADVLARSRTLLWAHCGDSKIDYFDPSRDGAFYIAKTAGGLDFDFELNEKNLKRLPYSGPTDIYESIQNNPFVPDHAKKSLRVKTLRVLKATSRNAISRTQFA